VSTTNVLKFVYTAVACCRFCSSE